MKERIITGIIGGSVFIGLIYIGGLYFAVPMFVLALLAYYEMLRMAGLGKSNVLFWVGILFLALITMLVISPTQAWLIDWLPFMSMHWLLACVLLTCLVGLVLFRKSFTIDQLGAMLIALFYIGFGFALFTETRLEMGQTIIFFILILIWTTDSAAYFCGRWLGRTKLSPHISPKKTVEGSVGGLIFAIIAALIFQGVTAYFNSLAVAVGLAILISCAGQLGDLVESAIKRYYQTKDSGHILPGHGGIFDRFDSLIFVFVLLYVVHIL